MFNIGKTGKSGLVNTYLKSNPDIIVINSHGNMKTIILRYLVTIAT